MTDTQYAAWLVDPSAIRLVLIEVVANVGGVETTRYLSTKGYVTGASDTPANTAYLPVVSTGIQFTEQISLTGGASMSAGDIEIYNGAGERDSWLTDIWVNRAIKAWIGDPRWVRSDFRVIFNGIVADVDSKSYDKINIKLRDKLQQLNTTVSDVLLGGTTPNKSVLIPLLFGECHNITPLLVNPATLQYQVNNGAVESIFEVRDNGYPVSVTVANSTGKFTLSANPSGAITVSAQGDKPSGVYSNTIAKVIQRIVTGFGSNKFTTSDLDLDPLSVNNLNTFDTAHPQPIGVYMSSRENVLTACADLADSIGAKMVMSRAGLLRLIQIQLPAVGTPTIITASQILDRTLAVSSRIDVIAAVKIGYCKNWTVQSSLLTNIPANDKDAFSAEWLTVTATDAIIKASYKLNTEPVQQDTMLLTSADATAEATRQLNIYKVPRTVYTFEGTPDLLLLELGQAVTIFHKRFGMSGGLTGVVVSLAPNWMTGHITVEVII